MSLFEVLIGVLILSIGLMATADIVLISSGSIFHELSFYIPQAFGGKVSANS